MKERPILFSAPMVRALLDGRKTQTRRIFKLPKRLSYIYPPDHFMLQNERGGVVLTEWETDEARSHLMNCPYGAPGDRLWVRETWSKAKSCNASDLFYRADGDRQYGRQYALSYVDREDRWRPSIHMPRWASRITLEVTGVRVERLQEISLRDVRAEGCEVREFWLFGQDAAERNATGAAVYRQLWESINGAGSWDSNPWVWVIEFKRVSP